MEKIKTGLWVNESKTGKKYMSGSFELDGKKYRLAMFRSDKKNEKSPDYTLYIEDANSSQNGSNEVKQETPQNDAYQDFANEVVISDEDLPF